MKSNSLVACLVSATIAVTPLAQAQSATPVAAGQTAAPASGAPEFRQEELDAVLTPIALYPDALLSQILAAST